MRQRLASETTYIEGRESGLDRMDGILFVLMISSRAARSAAAFGGHRPLTKSSTRTTSIHAIKAATRSGGSIIESGQPLAAGRRAS
jgi:hypothetical protein